MNALRVYTSSKIKLRDKKMSKRKANFNAKTASKFIAQCNVVHTAPEWGEICCVQGTEKTPYSWSTMDEEVTGVRCQI